MCRTRATPASTARAQPEDAQASTEFLDDWLARTMRVGGQVPAAICCGSTGGLNEPEFEPYLQQFAAYYYNRGAEWGKGVAINYKNEAFPEGTAVFDIERGKLDDIRAALLADRHRRGPRTPGATSRTRSTRPVGSNSWTTWWTS